jgi:hypothetical protein
LDLVLRGDWHGVEAWYEEHGKVTEHCRFTPECEEDIEARFLAMVPPLAGETGAVSEESQR